MTHEQIRIKCAEEVGWRSPAERSHYHPERKDQSIHGEHTWWLCGFAPNQNVLSTLPDYPSSLDACKELIEFAKAEGYAFRIEWNHDKVKASMWNGRELAIGKGRFQDSDSTPSLAICKAFLRWRGKL